MRKVLFFCLAFLLIYPLGSVAEFPSNGKRDAYAKDLLKVKLTSEAARLAELPRGFNASTTSFGINELDQLMSVTGGEMVIRAHRRVKDSAWEARTGFDRWFLIKLSGKMDVEEALTAFKQNRYIEKTTFEYLAHATAVPNDTYYANNWGHNNTAQLPAYSGGSHSGAGVGLVGFDSDAQLAWDQSQGYGSASIVIAIIDTGVDTSHPDLRLVTGYDYGDNDSNPMDDSADPGHGTACSGVAAGIANNGFGVAGIAGGCSVMPLKVANSAGSMYFSAIENAVTHAADNNAHIISMSLGADGMEEGDSPSTDAALTYAYNAGVAIFAATANGNTSPISYPSNHTAVISVGAASPCGERKSDSSCDGEYWWGSNYGTAIQDAREAVDIMAPTILPATDITGSGGYSSTDYSMWFNGTSCATPYAAGVGALVLSKDPSLTPFELRSVLTSTATDMTIDGGAGWDRYTGYGMVNANEALNSLVPGMPTCQIISPGYGQMFDLGSMIAIEATAADTDGNITQVAFYIDDEEIPSFTDYASPYSWNWDTSGVSGGNHTIKAIATDNDDNTAQSTVTVVLLAPPDEGFETGGFGAFPWELDGEVNWFVQSAETFSGTYAAQSGAISDNESSTMNLTLNITGAEDISFYQKVSSESGYDYLRFYIDGTLQEEWSGGGTWTYESYPVSTGSHTFSWTYQKDASVASGADCAWVDHIIFPAHTLPNEFYPPRNLAASGSDGVVYLTWDAPLYGSPTDYKIYRDGALLTTASGFSYDDYNVVNGNTYTYHLIAVYAGGESDPTPSVEATPNLITEVVLGDGTDSNGTSTACPINVYYQSLHGQSVYTAVELNAAGVYGPIEISGIGFNVTGLPNLAMPNYLVRLGHTSATNVSSWIPASALSSVWSSASYQPTQTGWNMLTLSSPFIWNGTDNLVVDTAYGLIGEWNMSGTTEYTSVSSGYRYVRDDYNDQTNVFSGGSTTTYRPNLKLLLLPTQETATIPLSQGWNLFSSWLEPDEPDMLSLFAELISAGYLVKVQDEAGNSVSQDTQGAWQNNIGDFQDTEGYYVKVNAACDLVIPGTSVSLPLSVPLQTGWNIISYPLDTAQDALTLVQPLIDSGLLVKVQNEAGNSISQDTQGAWQNNIGDFVPGEGYYLKVSGATQLTFTAPAKTGNMRLKRMEL